MLPSAAIGWKKYHTNGNVTDGCDYDVDAGRVSWSRSPLDNIKAVDILSIGKDFNPVSATIYSAHVGPFHQSDDYVVPILRSGTIEGRRVIRRIQRQLIEADYSFMVTYKDLVNTFIATTFNVKQDDLFIQIFNEADAPTAIVNSSIYHTVHQGNIGKWITVEIIEGSNNVEWYLSDTQL